MKKKYFTFWVLLILSGQMSSQVYFNWAKRVASFGSSQGNCLTKDSAGNIYQTNKLGYLATGSGIDVDPGASTLFISTISDDNFYVAKYDSLGNLIWASPFLNDGSYFGGVSSPTSLSVDKFGNVFSAGYLNSSIDFDPGPNTVASNYSSTYISKLDEMGNFEWVNFFEDARVLGITTDFSGNVLATGYFSNTVDFDPGIGVYNLTPAGGADDDIFVLKLDNAGNFKWAKRMGESTYQQSGYSIVSDSLDYVYTAGAFSGTVDFDPSLAVYNLTSSSGNKDLFVQKLDSLGNFVWAKHMPGGTLGSAPMSMKMASSNNIYLSGKFDAIGYTSIFAAKLTTNGVLKWLKQFGNGLSSSIDFDNIENIYLCGYFTGSADFDPGVGSTSINSNGLKDGFIAKYDSLGNFIWVKGIGGISDDHVASLVIDNHQNIMLLGTFESYVDFDPSTNVYQLASSFSNQFFLQWHQNPCSNFGISIDYANNANCSGGLGSAFGHGFGGDPPYTYSWNTSPSTADSIVTQLNGGIYTLFVNDSNNCQNSSSVLIDGPLFSAGHDVGVNIIGGPFRKNFSSYIHLDVYNNGCNSTNGQLVMILDPMLIYNNSIPSPDFIIGDTLIWNYYNLPYNNTTHFVPKVSVTTPLSANIGDTVLLKSYVLPDLNDIDSTNNYSEHSYPVINSFDPNDIQVSPGGVCEENYTEIPQTLTYTIRFQNTGTADAINITILDTLNQWLDINTLRILCSSHPTFAEITSSNILKFHFDSIQLPASIFNDFLSHGYVVFEITPKVNIPNYTLISNQVDIYFDFNEPIHTNSTKNTFVGTIPSCNVGIEEIDKKGIIKIYPNPTSGEFTINCVKGIKEIEIINSIGTSVYKINNVHNNLTTLSSQELSGGVYFIRITDSDNNQHTFKLIKMQ